MYVTSGSHGGTAKIISFQSEIKKYLSCLRQSKWFTPSF